MASAFLVAKLIDGEVVDMGSVGYFSMGILILAGFLAGRITGKGLGSMKPAAAVYAGTACVCFLILCNFLFFGGDLQGIGVCVVLLFLGSGLNLIPGRGTRGGKGKVRYKKPH